MLRTVDPCEQVRELGYDIFDIKEAAVTDVLIRGVSESALRRIEELAAQARISRGEYLRRELEKLAGPTESCTVEDLLRISQLTADLLDPAVMEQAWR
jgi:predicted transcriptional regulator of viral defense system